MNKLIILLFIIFIASGCSNSSLLFLANRSKDPRLDVNQDGMTDFLLVTTMNNNTEALRFNIPTISKRDIGEINSYPITGDFDGDGLLDYGTFESNDYGGYWQVVLTKDDTIFSKVYGDLTDIPAPADYDGDGKTDLVVYRPKNSGFYGMLSDKNKILEIHLGIPGDIPVPGDYDGDGKADVAVYQIKSGRWLYQSSKTKLQKVKDFKKSGYLPIQADYDGDKKIDFAIWNYVNNDIHISFSKHRKELSKNAVKVIVKYLNESTYPILYDSNSDGISELCFWDVKNKKLHIYNLKNINHPIYEQKSFDLETDYYPVSFYQLRKYMKRYLFSNKPFINNGQFSRLITWGKNGFSCSNCLQLHSLGAEYSDLIPFVGNFNSTIESLFWNYMSGKLLFFSDKGKLQIGDLMVGDQPVIGNFDSGKNLEVAFFRQLSNSFLFFDFKDIKGVDLMISGNKPIIADFDGDLIDDLGVYNSSAKNLSVRLSSSNVEKILSIGLLDSEKLVVGDFDGDGKADVGGLNVKDKYLKFFSSLAKSIKRISISGVIEGDCFAFDIDYDLKDDLIIKSFGSNQFRVLKSTLDYKPFDFELGEKESILVNYME